MVGLADQDPAPCADERADTARQSAAERARPGCAGRRGRTRWRRPPTSSRRMRPASGAVMSSARNVTPGVPALSAVGEGDGGRGEVDADALREPARQRAGEPPVAAADVDDGQRRVGVLGEEVEVAGRPPRDRSRPTARRRRRRWPAPPPRSAPSGRPPHAGARRRRRRTCAAMNMRFHTGASAGIVTLQCESPLRSRNQRCPAPSCGVLCTTGYPPTRCRAPREQFGLRMEATGIVRLRWLPGLRITGPLAAAAMAAVDELNGGLRATAPGRDGTAPRPPPARPAGGSASGARPRGSRCSGRPRSTGCARASRPNPAGVGYPVPTRFFTSETTAVAGSSRTP